MIQTVEKAYEDKLDGSITQDEYDKRVQKWKEEKIGYADRLEQIEMANEDYYMTAGMLLDFASRSYELFMGSEPEQKRQIITLTLQNLTWEDGKLHYEWVKPFDSIFAAKGSHLWGGESQVV